MLDGRSAESVLRGNAEAFYALDDALERLAAVRSEPALEPPWWSGVVVIRTRWIQTPRTAPSASSPLYMRTRSPSSNSWKKR